MATQSLSTRYIGTFPEYFPELTKLVDSSSDTLLIASGVSGYGIYTDHDRYVSYHAALERKVGLREFKVVVLDDTGVKELAHAQLLGQVFERDVRSTKAFKQFVEWSPYRAGQLLDMESFQQAWSTVEQMTRTQDFSGKGIKCMELSAPMPIYVWIADSKMAIFSIPDLQTPKPEENAFLTYDSRLIKELVTIFRTYEDRAAPAPAKDVGGSSH